MNLIDVGVCFCCHVHVFMCLCFQTVLVILHVFVSSNRASSGCAAMLSMRDDNHLFLYFVQSKVSHQGGGSVKWESQNNNLFVR